MAGQCSYDLDPDATDVDLQFTAADLDENGHWSCPHEADDEFCIFHKSVDEKSSADVRRELLTQIQAAEEAERNRRPQFVGIRVAQLDISSQIVGSIGVPIDLRNGQIGHLTVERSVINSDVDLRGCEIDDAFNAERATFEGDVNMIGLQGGTVTGQGAQFKARLLMKAINVESLDFEQATFEGIIAVRFLEVEGETHLADADFHDRADFERSEFRQTVDAHNATFRRGVDFSETLFAGQTTFSNAVFEGDIWLSRALFEQSVDFDRVTFEEQFTLDEVTLRDSVSFNGAIFAKGVWMRATAFEHEMAFVDATFDGSVTFAESIFYDAVDFRDAVMRDGADFFGVRFSGETNFENAVFHDELDLSPAVGSDPPDGRINLCQSTIREGTLSLPEGAEIVYDLEEATLGKATIAAGEVAQPLEHYRLVNVTYDGFDFAKEVHRDAFQASEWNLHRTIFDESTSRNTQFFRTLPRRFGLFVQGPKEIEPHVLESTYLKAKNGANDIGDSIAASEFFQREKLFRRWKHRQTASERTLPGATRVRAAFSWGENLGFSLVSGYGERPLRVVFSSLFLIVVFSLIYNFITEGPFEEAGLGDHLLFSFQSFITFILGTPPEAAAFEIQALSSIQGFLGAFFIALFVFTLTRSIDR